MTQRLKRIYRMQTAGRAVDYSVLWTDDVFNDPTLISAISTRRSLIVTTPTVARMYGVGIARLTRDSDASVLVLDTGEAAKTFDSVQRICAAAAIHRLGRRDQIIAIGGGVCMDLVTVAASLYRRGISHLRIPTTVIGQVDAGIGVKGAINQGGKNTLGCFHPPETVFIDPNLLATLTRRDVRSGLAEIAKMAIICDQNLFAMLEDSATTLVESGFQHPSTVADHVLTRSIALMSDELAGNLYEDGSLQRRVDAGHTFSPKIEVRTGFDVSHGEAVSIDLAFSASLGCELGLLSDQDGQRILTLLARIGLPIESEHQALDLCQEAIAEATRHRGGRANVPIPEEIGKIEFVSEGLDADLLSRCLTRHAAACNRALEVVAEQGRDSTYSHPHPAASEEDRSQSTVATSGYRDRA